MLEDLLGTHALGATDERLQRLDDVLNARFEASLNLKLVELVHELVLVQSSLPVSLVQVAEYGLHLTGS